VLAAALDAIGETGPSGAGLREIARRAGVSHATVTHHFGDKVGVFTAVATDGFRLLGDELGAAAPGGFLELGVAYVRFAVGHRAHFEVMFRPDLLRADDPALLEARARTSRSLYGGASEIAPGRRADAMTVGVAGWSLVHGIAQLWLSGNLPAELGDDAEQIARRVAVLLGPERVSPAATSRAAAARRRRSG